MLLIKIDIHKYVIASYEIKNCKSNMTNIFKVFINKKLQIKFTVNNIIKHKSLTNIITWFDSYIFIS